MNIYGYESEDSDLISLEEITIQADIKELKKLSAFIDTTITSMELNGEDFGHEHLSDFLKINIKPDIILTK